MSNGPKSEVRAGKTKTEILDYRNAKYQGEVT